MNLAAIRLALCQGTCLAIWDLPVAGPIWLGRCLPVQAWHSTSQGVLAGTRYYALGRMPATLLFCGWREEG